MRFRINLVCLPIVFALVVKSTCLLSLCFASLWDRTTYNEMFGEFRVDAPWCFNFLTFPSSFGFMVATIIAISVIAVA